MLDLLMVYPAGCGRDGNGARRTAFSMLRGAWSAAALAVLLLAAAMPHPKALAQEAILRTRNQLSAQQKSLPPRAAAARRFLAQRGWTPGNGIAARALAARGNRMQAATQALRATSAAAGTTSSATWSALGPAAVLTPHFGLVSGRVTSIAFDSSDATGNRVYVGTTGGGLWRANNAGATLASSIVFLPLTDSLSALGGATDASISIGAVTVQPGGTGVILAGTGDPNDVLDSYYGAGILRSADGGNTWSLIQQTTDLDEGLAGQNFSFVGEGLAGFAWSSANPALVVAAVSDAYEGTLVDAEVANKSFKGLYYSTDSGATWHLATMKDGNGSLIQGPMDASNPTGGTAVTAVVWNPARKVFVAAVRFHGYYSSADGVTWTRLAAQPGTGLTADQCPTRMGLAGSIACPIDRGALAVNPTTGDTFAWTVDLNNQDQGLWQDLCAISGGSCTNTSIGFSQQWNTAALETGTTQGTATIADGTYNLTLAAVPMGQQTMVLAGAHDLWQTMCPVSQGCSWRNTTNATSCMSAAVGAFQHALAWNAANPAEIFVGNDSGLWRSLDGIGETGAVCSAADASHFQNLNGQFENADGSPGSLAEPESLSPVVSTPYTLMAGLGVNGTAGVKASAVTADWPQILSGFGGPVAIDPADSDNWYVNAQAGVGIYRCSQSGNCTAADFGSSPVVGDADVRQDGEEMSTPAPFLVDPLDNTQLLAGTCRIWRGTTAGGWSTGNAVSAILDSGAATFPCDGDSMVRTLAAQKTSSTAEVVYAGMYGAASYGGNAAGHVFRAVVNTASGTAPTWSDLTLNAVGNDSRTLNSYAFDISSVVIDSHDATGNTVYVTVEGTKNPQKNVQTVYRSADGGATWNSIVSNLPAAPVSGLAVDPQDANTVYVATDQGVYFTTAVAGCAQASTNCWSVFGAGLPAAPVVALSAAPASASSQVLVAATYGRGIWQTALWSAGGSSNLAVASADPGSLSFASQVYNTTSSAQTVTLRNTGNNALTPTSISISGDFHETDNCAGKTIAAGSSCTIDVTFTPESTGALTGEMTIYANVYGGQLTVDLNGTGAAAGAVTISPATLDFGGVVVGATSAGLQVTAANSGTAEVNVSSVTVTSPFVIASNSCGTASLAASTDCQLVIKFVPTAPGSASGLLTFADSAGTQTVTLTGTGEAAPTDGVSPSSLSFPATATGQVSTPLYVTVTNTGDLPLNSISATVSGPFQIAGTVPATVAAHATGSIGVMFAPAALGRFTGVLTISDALGTQTVSLSGTGATAAAIGVTPTSMTFANTVTGVASAPQTLTVTNTGGATMANVGFQISGAATSSYTVSPAVCATSLASGASCTAQVVFTPSGSGAIAATLVVSSATAGVAAVQVPLNGTGLLAAGMTVSPSLLTFPVTGVGRTSTAQTLTVTNGTGVAVSAPTFAATAPFSVSTTTCTGSLAAGANCSASIVFAPTATGAASGTLTVSSTDVTTPATVTVMGTGYSFTATVSGTGSKTVVRGQEADYTLAITPVGSSGSFTFACGTLPSNALCLFDPATETLNNGVQGNVTVRITTGSSSASSAGRPELWRALPLACGLLLLPLAICRRSKIFLAAVLAVVLSAGVSSCASAGVSGGSSSSGGQSGGSGTAAGTYKVPVNITSGGMTQSVSLSLTVD